MNNTTKPVLRVTDLICSACTNLPDRFPHIHVGANTCTHPKYYIGRHGELVEREFINAIVVNETGDYTSDSHDTADLIAKLFAAAPQLLALVMRGIDEGWSGGDLARANELVAPFRDPVLSKDCRGGPYYTADGSPYQGENAS